ncbi:hypothetical protein AB0M57_11215 [Streptomyces sp. NPDC051597]|uniref:hypothetical protein n=1 Tax=Streptomyces sp. NPDC051597 TaxID=3155049 RepID=UPI0034314BC3
MTLTQWVPFATATATLLAAAVAYSAARRTARTTWRSTSAQWQYDAVLAFYNAAMYFYGEADECPRPRTDGDMYEGMMALEAAWLRLDLIGPGHLVEPARPVYRAARHLFDYSMALRHWDDLRHRADANHADVLELLDDDENRRPVLVSERDASQALCDLLDQALHPKEKVEPDWDKLAHAADQHAHLLRLSEGDDAKPVTGRDIEALRQVSGTPLQLNAELMSSWQEVNQRTRAFTPLVRAWLDGKGLR